VLVDLVLREIQCREVGGVVASSELDEEIRPRVNAAPETEQDLVPNIGIGDLHRTTAKVAAEAREERPTPSRREFLIVLNQIGNE
jgi:hypothetical protein